MYENKNITAKLNRTEFEHRILINNERHDIPIEPKNNSRQEYLSVILLDSVLIYPERYCSVVEINIILKYFLKNSYT